MIKNTKTFSIIIFLLLFAFLSGCLPKQLPPSQVSPSGVEQKVSEKTFTLEQLAEFDGKDGRPAYVAVDSLVYDVSQVFKDGSHYEHLAGKELTKEFYSRHVKAQIEKYPVVGGLVDFP